MLGPMYRDKDGVSAAAVFAEMAAELYAKGSSVSTVAKRVTANDHKHVDQGIPSTLSHFIRWIEELRCTPTGVCPTEAALQSVWALRVPRIVLHCRPAGEEPRPVLTAEIRGLSPGTTTLIDLGGNTVSTYSAPLNTHTHCAYGL